MDDSLKNKELQSQLLAQAQVIERMREVLEWFYDRPYTVISGTGDYQVGEIHVMHKQYRIYKDEFPAQSKEGEKPGAKGTG